MDRGVQVESETRPGILCVQKSQSSIKHIHYSSQLQHESHYTHDNRQAGTNNTPCSASSHHRVLRRRDASAGWLDGRQAEGFRRSAVAEAVAGAGAGVVHGRRRVALVASGRDRHDREGDGAVQFCRDS